MFEQVKLPDADSLLDVEIDRSNCGYEFVTLSVFDHWLSRNELIEIFPLDEFTSKTYSQRLYDFYKCLKGDKYEHIDDYQLLSNGEYLRKLRRYSSDERIMDFYLKDYGILVSGGFEYSDLLVYPKGHNVTKFKELAESHNLHVLD